MTSVNEQTPLLHSCQQYTPQSIENDPHTAAILRQSSRVLSEINEDILSGAYIFKEAVQSPLPWLSDKGVFAVRVVLAAVMTAMQGEYWWLECQRGNGRIFWFRFGNLVWAAQCYYMWLVALWSLICTSAEFTLPYTLSRRPCLRNRFLATLAQSTALAFLFRTLYTLVTTLPFPTTLFYLLIILPNPQTPAYPIVLPELLISIASSAIAFLEIFVLASVGPIPRRRCTHHMEQCAIVVLVVAGYYTLGVGLWESVGGDMGGQTDWRLLGGWGKEKELVAVEMACAVVAYFYAVVEFMHCCKYFCFLD